MTYFRELPNIQYPNFLENSTGSLDYLTMKNIFLRGKLRDDLQNSFTVFQKYVVKDGQRPDQIAEEVYGSATYDWVVVITANIINFQNEWALSSQQLYDYVVDKYGLEQANDVHHHETVEVKDNSGRLIMPSGIIVAEDFTIPNPDIPTSFLTPVIAISNFEYETRINDDKQLIYILRPIYLNEFVTDMRDIATYGFNSEFINPTTIRASNPRTTSP